MDIRETLRIIQGDLQYVKAARSSRPTLPRLNDSTKTSSKVVESSCDTVYIDRLREVLNAPKTGSVDITIRGR